ncbi:MAG: DUF4190 domain-containing protein [Aquiluna sp.]|jgi:hypothetical protein
MAASKKEETQPASSKIETPVIEEVKKERFDFRSLNTLAVVSLASALTSIGAVMAIITGHISLAQIKRSDENGKPLALAGLIIGYLTVIFWIILFASGVLIRARVLSDFSGLQPDGFEMHGFDFGFRGRER